MRYDRKGGSQRGWTRTLAVVALLTCVSLPAAAITPARSAGTGSHGLLNRASELGPGLMADRVVAPASLYAAIANLHNMVPSFSRQTGLACSACHYQFPELTPFGRRFKLNGYTLSGLKPIGQPGDSAGKQSLELSPIPQFSAMLLTSLTRTRTSLPGTQNSSLAFPDQFSVFVAGEVTPRIGVFSQFTYAGTEGSFGIDNIDLRYADRGTVAGRDVVYGLTLHNNPTVQDVWNTVPAWGFPSVSSATAPSAIASTLIDGNLGQQVVGLGAYSLYDNLLYTEFTAYRSSPQGFATPLDSSAQNVTAGVVPYWRVALQHETPSTSLMLGTFGFDAHIYPVGISGATDHFSDVAIDAQVERRHGPTTWIARGSVIHERQHLLATQAAGGSANVAQVVSTARASLAYLPTMKYGFTLGYFQTTGTADSTLYASQPIVGSRTGRPNTSGVTGEATYDAWQNTRLGLQYTAYNTFNGAANAYDVTAGRNA
ncbi:MAG: hypothetical protein ABI035_12360, partial [Gemmatimonadaceae bacterium]